MIVCWCLFVCYCLSVFVSFLVGICLLFLFVILLTSCLSVFVSLYVVIDLLILLLLFVFSSLAILSASFGTVADVMRLSVNKPAVIVLAPTTKRCTILSVAPAATESAAQQQ